MRSPMMYALSILILTGLILACCLTLDCVPPRELTDAHMWGVKRRIIRYAHEHNRLPSSLQALPKIPGLGAKTTDAWGREITYIVGPGDHVTLSSRPPSGAGPDIIRSFRTKNSQREWVAEMEPWTTEGTH